MTYTKGCTSCGVGYMVWNRG